VDRSGAKLQDHRDLLDVGERFVGHCLSPALAGGLGGESVIAMRTAKPILLGLSQIAMAIRFDLKPAQDRIALAKEEIKQIDGITKADEALIAQVEKQAKVIWDND